MKYSHFALIFGGGTGVRASTHGVPKQFVKVKNVPIIVRTIRKFEENEKIDAIVLVCLESYIPHMKKLIEDYNLRKVCAIVKGGKTGQESIYNGLCAIEKLDKDPDAVVLVHDAVRPLISNTLIEECLNTTKKYGNAISAVVCHETIAVRDGDAVKNILPRSDLVLLRAPQGFYFNDLFAYHNHAKKDGMLNFVDSASLAQYYGSKLHMVPSTSKNIKITYPEDIFILKALLDVEEHLEIMGMVESDLK